jgi:hypothetical protein
MWLRNYSRRYVVAKGGAPPAARGDIFISLSRTFSRSSLTVVYYSRCNKRKVIFVLLSNGCRFPLVLRGFPSLRETRLTARPAKARDEFFADRHCLVAGTPASLSGGRGFTSRPGDWLFCRSFSWLFSVAPHSCRLIP